MALILDELIKCKRCTDCGMPIQDKSPVIVLTTEQHFMYFHPECAQSIAKRILSDCSQLAELGYDVMGNILEQK
jgi:hypothetical protein